MICISMHPWIENFWECNLLSVTGLIFYNKKKVVSFSFFFQWYITEKFELKSHIRDENRKFFLLIKITTLTYLNVAQKSVKAWIAVNKVSVLTDQKFCSYQFALELQACAGLQFLKEDVVVKKKTCKFWYMTLFERVAFHKQNLLSTNCCMLL